MIIRTIIILIATAGLALGAQAGQLFSRAELDSVLIGGGTLDDFERFDVANGQTFSEPLTRLDSTTTFGGQTGLVQPGAVYTGSTRLNWLGAGYQGLPSKAITFTSGRISEIVYDSPVQAFGFDLFTLTDARSRVLVEVGNNTTRFGTFDVDLSPTGKATFFGWVEAQGITRVTLKNFDHPWSVVADDHRYGVVPEPATLLALASAVVALAHRRRKA